MESDNKEIEATKICIKALLRECSCLLLQHREWEEKHALVAKIDKVLAKINDKAEIEVTLWNS